MNWKGLIAAIISGLVMSLFIVNKILFFIEKGFYQYTIETYLPYVLAIILICFVIYKIGSIADEKGYL
jgi:hypothetical protein